MTLTFDLRDLNGRSVNLGDKICAYAQEYEVTHREETPGETPVECLDTTRPKPFKDVPLFIGRVVWSDAALALEVKIEEVMVRWEIKPASVFLGGGQFVFEVLDP